MRKLLVTFLPILSLLLGCASACSPAVKIAARQATPAATLTPFQPQATFTAVQLPAQQADDLSGAGFSPTGTAVLNQTEAASEGEPNPLTPSPVSLTPTRTGSPTLQGPTATVLNPSATLSGPLPSSTALPLPSATAPPVAPSATAAPIDSSPTVEPPAQDPTAVPPSPTSLPTATTAPPPTAAPTATAPPQGCSPTGNAAYENQVVNLINQERADRGLPALTQNASLRQAARRHSEDMACNDFFSHTGSDGSTLSSRLLAAGYSYSWAAENIAASSSPSFSPQSVVNMWMNSAGHKKNILSENAVHIGVGFRYAGDSDAGDLDAYYTADFGRP